MSTISTSAGGLVAIQVCAHCVILSMAPPFASGRPLQLFVRRKEFHYSVGCLSP